MSESLIERLQNAATRTINPFGEHLSDASIRTHNADFIVEEDLGFEPEGDGEFLFLWVEKDGQNTDWVAGQLASALDVKRASVSYSGRKDRHAVTRQWFCIHWLNRDMPVIDMIHIEGCMFLKASRHPRKLRTGVHKSNRFALVLRNIDAEQAKVNERLEHIQKTGVPNYVGIQRFGRDGGNIHKALQWVEAGQAPRQKNLRSMYLSSLRSALFNYVLTARVQNNSWNTSVDGEYFVLDGARTGFSWGKRGDDWQQRLNDMDIHPSISLAGKGKYRIEGDALKFEQALLEPFVDINEFLSANRLKVEQRSSRLKVDDLKWQWSDGATLEMTFNLVRGAFATSVLDMIFNSTDGSFSQKHLL